MARVIRCDCGFESTGESDDALVSNARAHARDVHGNDLADGLLRALVQTTLPHDPPTKGKGAG